MSLVTVRDSIASALSAAAIPADLPLSVHAIGTWANKPDMRDFQAGRFSGVHCVVFFVESEPAAATRGGEQQNRKYIIAIREQGPDDARCEELVGLLEEMNKFLRRQDQRKKDSGSYRRGRIVAPFDAVTLKEEGLFHAALEVEYLD